MMGRIVSYMQSNALISITFRRALLQKYVLQSQERSSDREYAQGF